MKKRVLALVVPLALILVLIAAPALAAVAGTLISNTLEATTAGIEINEQVAMTWSLTGGEDFTEGDLTLSMVVNTPVTIYVRTTSMMGEPIPRVRFLAATDGDYYTIEVTDSSLPADTWRGVLTYDVTEGGYVFGPTEGFVMPNGYVATTTLSVAAKVSGSHTASVYAVQLPAD